MSLGDSEERHINFPRTLLDALEKESKERGLSLSKTICQHLEQSESALTPSDAQSEIRTLRDAVRDNRDAKSFLHEITSIYQSIRHIERDIESLKAVTRDVDLSKMRYDLDSAMTRLDRMERR